MQTRLAEFADANDLSDIILILDATGAIAYANSAVCLHLGWLPEELIGRSFLELIGHEDADSVRGALDQLHAYADVELQAHVVRHNDGSLRTLHATATNLLLEPLVRGILICAKDATDQEQAETRIRLQTGLLDAVLTASDDGIISWALDGTLLSWNRAAEHLLGYVADEILGRSVTTVVPADCLAEVAAICAQLRDGEHVGHYSTKCVRKDGQLIDVSIACSPLDDTAGHVVATAAIIREVTARVESRRQLSDSEQRFRSLFEHHPDAIYTLDTRGCYTALNPAVKRRFGYDPDDIVGLPFGQRGAPPIEHKRALKAALSGKSVTYESATHDGFGRILPVQVSLAPIIVDDKVVGAFGITKDISARKSAEELLRRHARQQAALADLGLWALEGSPIQDLYSAAASLIADLLDVELTAILQVLPDSDELLLTGGVGWPEASVGCARFAASADSMLGFMLTTTQPVRIDNVEREARFSLEPIAGRGMRSGLAVIVPGMTAPNGALLAFTSTNLRFSEEDLSCLQSIANVIGAAIDRAAAGAELRRREHEFKVLVEHAADNIVRIDRDLRFMYVNPAVERMTGIPASRLVGQRLRYASETDAESWDLALHRVFRRGESEEVELTYPSASGERYFQVRLSPEVGPDGAVNSVLGVGREITSVKLREMERAELYRELLDRNERLHEMVERALFNQGQTQANRTAHLPAVDQFTTRERQILTLLGRGLTNKQIARELSLSAGTVKNYVASLLPRLHATDRTHAAVLACKLGLVSTDDA